MSSVATSYPSLVKPTQMLTMARSLGTEPKLLLIDEPTEGLMPAFVETISQTIIEIQTRQRYLGV